MSMTLSKNCTNQYETATAEPPQFSALSHLSFTTTGMSTLSENCNCGTSTVFCSVKPQAPVVATTDKSTPCSRTAPPCTSRRNNGHVATLSKNCTLMHQSSQQRACQYLVQEMQLRKTTGCTVWTISPVLHNNGQDTKT